MGLVVPQRFSSLGRKCLYLPQRQEACQACLYVVMVHTPEPGACHIPVDLFFFLLPVSSPVLTPHQCLTP